MNLVPGSYRSISVARVGVPLTEAGLRAHFTGRPAYRRTRYIVVTADDGDGAPSAVIEVAKRSEVPLFSEIVAVTLIAGSEETVVLDAPEADTAIPTTLGMIAADRGGGARCVVVRGRYGHVGFIADPAPVPVGVAEVIPPLPAKLLDQAGRVLAVAEDLPPVRLVPQLTDLRELAAARPAAHYLFPCRAGGAASVGAGAAGTAVAGGAVSYLDEIPPRADWTLVGCARSRAIHDWFYDGPPPAVDMCPRNLARTGATPVLTKCCLLEDRISVEDGLVVVPWGATLAQVREGLDRAVEIARTAAAAP